MEQEQKKFNNEILSRLAKAEAEIEASKDQLNDMITAIT